MKKISPLLLIVFCFSFAKGQDHGFPFGEFSYSELNMTKYEKDTSANAVILQEFGEAYIQNDGTFNLVLEYHVKIKILKKDGLDEANFSIPLHKQDGREEMLKSVEASTFTIIEGSAREFKFDGKSIFTENRNKYNDLKKFTLPSVRVGSVIEVKYVLESPFIYNFRPWDFQSYIPKIQSEYWATIPGNYHYNMTLRGFLKLASNDSELISECFTPGGGRRADCARYKFNMKDIPAFVAEEYMTASRNFISSINFELSEIKYFDGHVDKITKEWKDAEEELRRDSKFGIQLRRGKDVVDEKVEQVIIGDSDPLSKAMKIYYFIKDWYEWDEVYSKYSEFGIKKAFDTKKGNVGDINLSLLAALKYAGLHVEPLILSTRENGFPIELHPVLSDFNYVIAKLNVGDKVYLLDATDDYSPFGILPIRCLNGKGRVLGEKESYWYEIKPADKMKHVTILNLKLESDGFLRGTFTKSYTGYESIRQRKKIKSFNNENDYVKDLGNKWSGVVIKKHQLTNVDEIDKPLTEKLDIEIDGYDDLNRKTFFFNPFIVDRWQKNPFKSQERLYPVDFAMPLEEVMILNLEFPEGIEAVDLPEKIGLSLPNNGGRYIFDVQQVGNRITVNHSLVISKALFTSEEYYYLKELYSRIIQVQNSDLVFKRK